MSKTADPSLTITELCEWAGVSRQAYYRNRQRSKKSQKANKQVLEWIHDERAKHPRMGGKKLYYRLNPKIKVEGIKMGRDKLFKLLREHDLLVKPRRSRAPRTTCGAFTRWTNKLAGTPVGGPNQAWVADITYLRSFDSFCYLALISDKYSRKIIGWDVAESLELDGALRALEQGLDDLDGHAAPIHHSDRGSQYRSNQYIKQLTRHGCTISMTEDDHCAENAQAERLNGILKNEYLLDQTFLAPDQAREAARQAIELYNGDRPH